MTTTHKLATPTSADNALSTELDSLANAARVVSASPVDNGTDLYLYADIELYLASLTVSANGYVDVYMTQSIDGGSTYEDGDASTPPGPNAFVGRIFLNAGTGAQRPAALKGIVLDPVLYNVIVENHTGASLASSGNLLRMIRYNEQDV